ncbi:MAG: hypothetical protein ACOX36_03900 [Saccharofermentanales bacterium]|jgi:hypothetical protein
MRKRKLFSIPIILAITIVQSMYFYSIYKSFINSKAHLFLFYVYAGVVSLDGVAFVPVFVFSLSFFIQLSLFSNQINDDFIFASTYIFTRTKNRVNWLLKHYGRLLIDSIGFYLLQFFTTFVIAMFYRCEFDLAKWMLCSFFLLCTLVICNTVFTVIAAVVSVKRNTALVSSVFYIFYVAWILLLPFFPLSSLFVSIFPVSNALLFLHKEVWEILDVQMVNPILETSQVTFLLTGVFVALSIIVILLSSAFWINKKNIMEEL